jgi:hypothetical protein
LLTLLVKHLLLLQPLLLAAASLFLQRSLLHRKGLRLCAQAEVAIRLLAAAFFNATPCIESDTT